MRPGRAAPAAGAPTSESEKFVVHEWGTFSTFSGSDGKPLKFYPNDRDLPPFVYNRFRETKGGLPDVYVSLETPVLYFYTDRDRTVSVQVDFPKGLMTDWYPQASRPPETQLRWDDLKVLADDRPKLKGEGDAGRYFAARETDAATVRTSGRRRREDEQFLFYRGVGDFHMPFVVRAHGDGKFTVQNTGKHPVPGYVLLNVKDRKVTFKVYGHLSPGARRRSSCRPRPRRSRSCGTPWSDQLVDQGLYEKEARAMVKTWRNDWFGEDGTRVLYLVAEPLTDEFLPLKIDPKPDQTVRVLVGRHDVLTPEREKEIDAVVKRLNGRVERRVEGGRRRPDQARPIPLPRPAGGRGPAARPGTACGRGGNWVRPITAPPARTGRPGGRCCHFQKGRRAPAGIPVRPYSPLCPRRTGPRTIEGHRMKGMFASSPPW